MNATASDSPRSGGQKERHMSTIAHTSNDLILILKAKLLAIFLLPSLYLKVSFHSFDLQQKLWKSTVL